MPTENRLRARRILVLFALLLAGSVAKSQQDNTARPQAPGRLVDLGGYKLHLWCSGSGTPAVVLSSGSGDFSFDWTLVQSEIGRTTRVCSYDRGGEAWSDLGPSPLTLRQEAFDLRRMLQKSAVSGPYVIVGHSLGGMLAEVFASQYPLDLSGLVLVDASNWNSLLNINGKVAAMKNFSKHRTIPEPRSQTLPSDRLSAEALQQIKDFVKQYDMQPRIEPPYDKLPAIAQGWRLWALSQPSHWAATQNEYFGEEAELLSQWAVRTTHPLGSLPLVVLSRKTPEKPNELDEDHETHQRELADLSSRGRLIFVPQTGHHIQLEQPNAVIAAIKETIGEVRQGNR